MGRGAAKFRVLLASVVLAGCQTEFAGNPPAPAAGVVTAASTPRADGSNSTIPSSASEALFETAGSEPMEFVKIQSNIPRGVLVGKSISQVTRCYGLRPYVDRPYYWNEENLTERSGDFADAFFYAGRDAGLDVVGDPRQLFENREDRSRATLAVAAEVTRLRFEFCDHMHCSSSTGSKR